MFSFMSACDTNWKWICIRQYTMGIVIRCAQCLTWKLNSRVLWRNQKKNWINRELCVLSYLFYYTLKQISTNQQAFHNSFYIIKVSTISVRKWYTFDGSWGNTGIFLICIISILIKYTLYILIKLVLFNIFDVPKYIIFIY